MLFKKSHVDHLCLKMGRKATENPRKSEFMCWILENRRAGSRNHPHMCREHTTATLSEGDGTRARQASGREGRRALKKHGEQ